MLFLMIVPLCYVFSNFMYMVLVNLGLNFKTQIVVSTYITSHSGGRGGGGGFNNGAGGK